MKLTLDYSQGLHEKANTEQFKKPERMAAICAELLRKDEDPKSNLARLLWVTEKKARIRRKQHYYTQLTRSETPGPADAEERLERAIWINWRLHPKKSEAPSRQFLSNMLGLLAYQVPLYDQRKKDSWGAIDLVGVSTNHLPVVIEVKQELSEESPLRMLLQAAAYAVSIQNAWRPKFRSDWLKALKHVGISIPDSQIPEELKKCQLVCLAPSAFWQKWTGADTRIGDEAWLRFAELVSALETMHGLSVEFAALDMSVSPLRLPNCAPARP